MSISGAIVAAAALLLALYQAIQLQLLKSSSGDKTLTLLQRFPRLLFRLLFAHEGALAICI